MLTQKLVLSFSIKIFIQMIQVVATIVVARVAGPSILGTVAFGLAYVSMFRFIGDLGLGSAHAKIVNEDEDLGRCNTTYAVLHVISKLGFVLVVVAYFVVQKYVFHVSFESSQHESVILIFVIMILVQTASEIPIATFMAKMQQARQDIPEMIRNLFLQPMRIVTVLLGGMAVALALVNLASALLVIPIYWFIFRHYRFGKFDRRLARKYIKYGIPLIVLGVATSLSRTLDKVLLQYFTSSEQVGYYTAGFKIGSYLVLIGHSTGLLFFPLFAKAVTEKNIEVIRQNIFKYERFIVTFIMPLVVLLAIYADSVVMLLLGRGYIPAVKILSIITVSSFLYILNVPYGNVIAGLGHFGLVAKINLANIGVIALANVVLVFPALLNLKGEGTAWAMLISNIYLGIAFRGFARAKLPSLDITRYLKFLVFGIVSFFVFSFLYRSYFTGSLLLRLIYPPVYFAGVYLILHAMKWMKGEDWRIILRIFSLKKMKEYISREMVEK